MYEMAKKAREAMKSKAKRLSGEKDGKVDSSDWSPAEPLNADVKTGMRPISKRAYKKGGKVEGEAMDCHAGRKPRKSGGRAITANSLINRNQKEANAERDGKKHIGGMKKGGRAKYATTGGVPARTTMERVKNPNPSPDYSPKTDPNYKPAGGPSQEEKDALKDKIEGRKAGGKVNFGPMGMPGGKPGVGLSEQKKIAKHDQDLSKPSRGKAAVYKKGGKVHEDVAEDKALIKKMVKPSARVGKFYGGGLGGPDGMPVAAPPAMPAPPMMPNMGAGKPMGYKSGGKAGKTHIAIMINAGQKQPGADGMPPMPPGGPGAPGGVPVPMGMPPAGGAPAPMPMPMPMPAPAPAGGPPMARKAGGKVYRSYKDMDAGAGSGLGRLEKTEIQKRRA